MWSDANSVYFSFSHVTQGHKATPEMLCSQLSSNKRGAAPAALAAQHQQSILRDSNGCLEI